MSAKIYLKIKKQTWENYTKFIWKKVNWKTGYKSLRKENNGKEPTEMIIMLN